MTTAQVAGPLFSTSKPATEDGRVAVAMGVEPAEACAGETFDVVVELDVSPTYEVHPMSHAGSKALPVRLELELPKGLTATGDWSQPETVRSGSPEGGRVHVGRVVFTRRVRVADDARPGAHRLTCSIRYQACNAQHCLAPDTVQLGTSITVVR